MSRIRSIEVSASQSQALVVGKETWLTKPLTQELEAINIQAHLLPSKKTSLTKIEVDYLFIVQSVATEDWLNLGNNAQALADTLPLIGKIGGKAIFVRLDNHTSEIYNDLRLIAQESGVDTRTVILDEVYGDGVPTSSVIKDYLQQSLLLHKIDIPGDGLQGTHPTHIKDTVSGIIKFAIHPYMSGRELLLLNPESVSCLSLAYKIRNILDEKVEIKFLEEEPPTNEKIDWDRTYQLQQDLGWQPSVSLEEGINELLTWLRSQKPTAASKLASKESVPEAKQTSDKPAPHPTSARKLQPLHSHLEDKPDAPASFLSKLSKPKKKSQEVKFVKIEKRKKLTLQDLNKKLTLPKIPKASQYNTPLKRALIIITSLILLYVATIGVAVLLFFSGLKGVKASVQEGEYSKISSYEDRLRLSTAYLKTFTGALSSLPLIGGLNSVQEADILLQQTERGIEVVKNGHAALNIIESIFKHILNQENVNLVDSIAAAKVELDSFYQSLSLLDGELSDKPPAILPGKYQSDYLKLHQELTRRRKEVGELKGMLNILPDLIALNSRKKYLVLLQNNMELRPTGGFIGSFATVSFQNGQLTDLQISDVYSADGQLKGHVEPPATLKKHLGEATWYLRDSNWDPDFPRSAKRAEWFLEKEINTTVDGVVALNLYTIKDIISAVGPLQIPDYNEEITADNLFERAEYHSEINFFPGSTQKKEFLASLADTLFVKVQNSDASSLVNVGRAILSSLHSKHTLLYVNDTSVQALFDTLNWSGSVKSEDCPSLPGIQEPQCLNDYIYTVDANVGINKANYFVRKKYDLLLTVDKEQTVTSRFIQTYTNTAKSAAWPAGNYKNFQRLYLPMDVDIRRVVVDGKILNSNEYDIASVDGKTELSYLVEIPINSTVATEVEYWHSRSLESSDGTLALYWQKQSGSPAEPLNITVSHPLFLEPTIISPQAEVGPGSVSFTLNNNSDHRVLVKF